MGTNKTVEDYVKSSTVKLAKSALQCYQCKNSSYRLLCTCLQPKTFVSVVNKSISINLTFCVGVGTWLIQDQWDVPYSAGFPLFAAYEPATKNFTHSSHHYIN